MHIVNKHTTKSLKTNLLTWTFYWVLLGISTNQIVSQFELDYELQQQNHTNSHDSLSNDSSLWYAFSPVHMILSVTVQIRNGMTCVNTNQMIPTSVLLLIQRDGKLWPVYKGESREGENFHLFWTMWNGMRIFLMPCRIICDSSCLFWSSAEDSCSQGMQETLWFAYYTQDWLSQICGLAHNNASMPCFGSRFRHCDSSITGGVHQGFVNLSIWI